MIVDGINASSAIQGGVATSELFTGGKKQHFRRMAVGASSQIFQQLGGCNAVIYYGSSSLSSVLFFTFCRYLKLSFYSSAATVLFEQSIGLETQLSLILGGVLSTVYFLASISSFWLVETLGRRKMCTFSISCFLGVETSSFSSTFPLPLTVLIGSAGQMVAMIITFGCLIPYV